VEQRKQKENKRELFETLSQKAALSSLVKGIAHEIRNAMAGMLGRAEIILKHPEKTEEVKKFAILIQRGIFRLLSIMDALSQYKTVSQRSVQKVDLKKILEDILCLIEGTCREQQIQIHKNFCEKETLFGDAGLLHQVFLNVILNAMEAFSEKEKKQITLSTSETVFENTRKQTVHGIKITIHDTGIGISDSLLKHVFNPFFTTKYHHAGMGLTLALRHVLSHNGVIDITSNPPDETLVTIHLPFSQET